jgi:hypothetical protein
MRAAMNASRVPTVQDSNGRYAVAIAPGVVLPWWFELRDGGTQCFVKVDLPDVLKRYQIDIDGKQDPISFPVDRASPPSRRSPR